MSFEQPNQTNQYTNETPPTTAFHVQPKKKNHAAKTGTAFAAVALVAALIGGGVGGSIVSAQSSGSTTNTTVSSTVKSETAASVSAPEDLSDVISTSLPSIVTVSVVGSQASGTGSGVILNNDGYIVTNAHVATLEGTTGNGTITIQTSTGDVYDAELVAYDATSDLAVLKAEGELAGTTPISFASSNELEVGETVIAIGSPLGLSGTVTTGVVSALNRPITVQSAEVNANTRTQQSTSGTTVALNAVQTDAAINSGNSGGALLNADGNLIGINVAIASSGDNTGSIGVGFAIPSDYVKRITTELIENGEASHGFFGANVQDYQQDDTAFTAGAEIASVSAGSAAETAGIKEGDVITEVNDARIESSSQFSALIKQQAPGNEITVTYTRDGEENTVTVKLGEVS